MLGAISQVIREPPGSESEVSLYGGVFMQDYGRYQFIKVEREAGVLTLTLNRPDRLNAVNAQLHRELEEIFEDVRRDEARAIVLTGAGRAFCVGADLKETSAMTENPTDILWQARRLMNNMLWVDQPIIAAVNGDAVGLGATLALFCDVIYAAEGARFADTHVRAGLVAGDGGAIIWPMLVGLAKAKEYVLTGDLISAMEAERIGLINKVLPSERLLFEATELARRLAGGPPKAIQWTKLAMNKQLRDQVNLVIDLSLSLEGLSMYTEDQKEAVRAFLEKRQPQFKGR